MFETQSKVQ